MHTSFNTCDKNGINLNLELLSLWHKSRLNTQQKVDENLQVYGLWQREGINIYKQPSHPSNIKFDLHMFVTDSSQINVHGIFEPICLKMTSSGLIRSL